MISKNMDLSEGCVFPVDKPYRWTSTDVVRKISNLLKKNGYKKIKVGHAGTLDPLATGLLIVCIGKATKQAAFFQAQEKEYVAEITLGATTPSYDLEHAVDQRFPYEHITEQMVKEALLSFIGEHEQMPPVYSAKRLDGKRGYEYARAGKEVEMKKAIVSIYAIELILFELPVITVRVRCSKGTYIRSIAHDLGEKLGCGAHLSNLRRTRSGDFNVNDAYTMEQIGELLSAAGQHQPE